MDSKKMFLILFLVTTMIFSGCIKYMARNQMDLHNKLSQKKMKVAVLPFTLNTPPKEKRIAFENVDIELTNKFTEIIWKKNKVRIAHNNEVLAAIKEVNLKYGDMNPEMEDLLEKPSLPKIFELGKKLGVNVVFTGTPRTNKFDYEGGCCCLMPSLLAKKRVYNIGAQMMAVDIDKEEILAFDFIDNRLAVPVGFSVTGGVSDKALAKGKENLLAKCGFALAYYAPKPEIRTDKTAIGLQTGAALLNAFAGTEFSVDTSIKDETWKMYPEGYFMENFGYTRNDFDNIPR